MANVLGFDYEDLMAMFYSLGLVGYVNDLFKVIKHGKWSVKLALPIPYTMD